MSLAVAVLLCATSGAATSFAFPPRGWWWLLCFSSAPWLVVVLSMRPALAVLGSIAFGIGVSLPLGAWVPGVLRDGFGVAGLASHALGLLLSLSYVPAIVLLGALLSSIRREPLFAIAAGLGWALVELSHAHLWPRIPWLVVGAPLIDTPLARASALVGVHGLSALVIATNAVVAAVLLRQRGPGIVGAGFLLTGAFLPVVMNAGLLSTKTLGRVRVALVQPGVVLGARPDARSQHEVLEALLALSDALPRVDLIVWPENSLLRSMDELPAAAERITTAAVERDAPFIVGVHRYVDAQRRNAVVLLRPSEVPRSLYEKRHLLPLVEAPLPWLSAASPSSLGRLASSEPMTPGRVPLGARGLRIGRMEFSICFESAFSEPPHDPRATLLVNVANDSWYDTRPAAAHLLLLARWRAIEQHAPLLRAATTGISALVGVDGQVIAHLPVGARGSLIVDAERAEQVTPFESLGYAPVTWSGIALWAVALTRSRRARSRDPR